MHREGASLSRNAVHADSAAVALNNPVDHREAHPGSLPGPLGGEVGVENGMDDPLCNAHAGVGNDDLDVVSGFEVQALLRSAAVSDHDIVHGYRENAAPIFHGVSGIGKQIHEYLMNLCGISHHQGIGFDFVLYLHRGGKGGADESDHLLGDRPRLNRLDFLVRLASKGQYLPDQIPSALSAGIDLLKVVCQIRARL